MQVPPTPQLCPHCPQLRLSAKGLTQLAEQASNPGAHTTLGAHPVAAQLGAIGAAPAIAVFTNVGFVGGVSGEQAAADSATTNNSARCAIPDALREAVDAGVHCEPLLGCPVACFAPTWSANE